VPSIFARTRSRFGADVPTPGPAADHAGVVDRPASAVDRAMSPPGPDPTALRNAPVPGVADPAPPASGPAAAGRAAVVRTRIGGIWVAVIVAAWVLVFFLIFVLQNPTRVEVFFLGAAGTLPLGVAMLFAAIAGALVGALIGSARIIQLRRTARRRGGHVTPPPRVTHGPAN
jgi:uncharacterized integral membrane protein